MWIQYLLRVLLIALSLVLIPGLLLSIYVPLETTVVLFLLVMCVYPRDDEYHAR